MNVKMFEILKHTTLQFASDVMTTTPVKMNKKDVETKSIQNPFGEIVKVNKLNVTFNFDYAHDVNAALLAEGKEANFVPSARKWGKHVAKSIIEHEDELYVMFKVNNKLKATEYFSVDGETLTPIDYEQIKPFLPKTKVTEKKVDIRTVKINNVEVL